MAGFLEARAVTKRFGGLVAVNNVDFSIDERSISSLIGSNPAGARQMCIELAEFFRESLRAGARARIPLSTEVDLVRRYLAIERLRFGERLEVKVEIDDDARDLTVPPLLLQPLAENAVRHGIDTLAGVIDSDYRGEVRVVLVNHGGQEFRIEPGDRIAQLLVQKVERPAYERVAALEPTARGAAGFGSTGS